MTSPRRLRAYRHRQRQRAEPLVRMDKVDDVDPVRQLAVLEGLGQPGESIG
jgi:hypothetical protein